MRKIISAITLVLTYVCISNAWWPAEDSWFPTGPYWDNHTWATITELGTGVDVAYFKVSGSDLYLAFSITTNGGKAKYAALLTAYTNSKGIKFWATKTPCVSIGGLGSGCVVEYINVQP